MKDQPKCPHCHRFIKSGIMNFVAHVCPPNTKRKQLMMLHPRQIGKTHRMNMIMGREAYNLLPEIFKTVGVKS